MVIEPLLSLSEMILCINNILPMTYILLGNYIIFVEEFKKIQIQHGLWKRHLESKIKVFFIGQTKANTKSAEF